MDEMTNSDFICMLNKASHEDFSFENSRIILEAARRIRKLENTVNKLEDGDNES
jgi:hypothetical protein